MVLNIFVTFILILLPTFLIKSFFRKFAATKPRWEKLRPSEKVLQLMLPQVSFGFVSVSCLCGLASIKSSRPNFIALLTVEFCGYEFDYHSPLTVQRPHFCASCVSGECLVTLDYVRAYFRLKAVDTIGNY